MSFSLKFSNQKPKPVIQTNNVLQEDVFDKKVSSSQTIKTTDDNDGDESPDYSLHAVEDFGFAYLRRFGFEGTIGKTNPQAVPLVTQKSRVGKLGLGASVKDRESRDRRKDRDGRKDQDRNERSDRDRDEGQSSSRDRDGRKDRKPYRDERSDYERDRDRNGRRDRDQERGDEHKSSSRDRDRRKDRERDERKDRDRSRDGRRDRDRGRDRR